MSFGLLQTQQGRNIIATLAVTRSALSRAMSRRNKLAVTSQVSLEREVYMLTQRAEQLSDASTTDCR